MNEQRIVAILAAAVLIGLPIAEYAQSGQVSSTFVGALVVLAFGGGGFAADKALKDRVRYWLTRDDMDDGNSDPPASQRRGPRRRGRD